MTSKREAKGINLVVHGCVKPAGPSKFMVKSSSSGERYIVEWKRKRWTCSCKDFAKKHRKCKHIYAVCYYLTLRDLQAGVKRLGGGREKCPHCGKDDMVIKDGYSETRSGLQQRYYCKRCNRGFTPRTGFEGMHGQALAILLALDLYYRGLSLRQIAEHLQSVYGIAVSHGTIYGWIKRYVNIISEHIKRLEARTSERWHADDTVVRIKGKHFRVWGMLDNETRFLIADYISAKRDAKEVQVLLDRGLQRSGNKPLEIVTDGAPEYAKAISETFGNNDPLIHVQAAISTPLSNNKMERFFRTLKQRYKTINSFYSQDSAKTFIEGFEAFYNFIRGHRSLNGLTPAQVAGLVDEKLNWLNLINGTTQKRECTNKLKHARRFLSA